MFATLTAFLLQGLICLLSQQDMLMMLCYDSKQVCSKKVANVTQIFSCLHLEKLFAAAHFKKSMHIYAKNWSIFTY